MKADQLPGLRAKELGEQLAIARLLTAVFADYTLRDIFIAMGLDLCPYVTKGLLCHQPNIDPTFYPYCVQPHKRASKKPSMVVALICEDCGIRFYRPLSVVKGSINHGQTRIFCGKECVGRWAGNTRGFGGHPENIRLGKPSAQNHCGKGHPYSPENTYDWGSQRRCRTCGRERQRRYDLAKRQSKLTKHMREHW